jgi:hypothetical protein
MCQSLETCSKLWQADAQLSYNRQFSLAQETFLRHILV